LTPKNGLKKHWLILNRTNTIIDLLLPAE